MILKASQRGGGKQLAMHLLRTDENEHVEIHEVRGFLSGDVIGAFKEAYAVSRGTKCRQFLFSVSLNPPQTETVGIGIFENAADRIEKATGLEGHPRVIVFHEKEGRRHAHAVWSRIDAETMTAKNLSHFKLKLREISRELYLENDWQMPRGLMNSREADPRNFTLEEWQQAKRAGTNARDLKGMVQECWAASDSRPAFAQALSERGLTLARGDRRGHVAVTHEGEVLSIARYAGKKAKEVRAKLGEPDDLPGVEDARAQMAKDMAGAMGRHLEEARQQHRRETAPLEQRRQDMTALHRQERERLDAGQKERWEREAAERAARLHKGLHGLWDRLTGRHERVICENVQEAQAALERDREQRQAVIAAQLQERQLLQEQIRNMRIRHGGQLLELHRDRERFEAIAPKPPKLKEPFERVAALRYAPEPKTPEIVQLPQPPPVPTPAERLHALREHIHQPAKNTLDRGDEYEPT